MDYGTITYPRVGKCSRSSRGRTKFLVDASASVVLALPCRVARQAPKLVKPSSSLDRAGGFAGHDAPASGASIPEFHVMAPLNPFYPRMFRSMSFLFRPQPCPPSPFCVGWSVFASVGSGIRGLQRAAGSWRGYCGPSPRRSTTFVEKLEHVQSAHGCEVIA